MGKKEKKKGVKGGKPGKNPNSTWFAMAGGVVGDQVCYRVKMKGFFEPMQKKKKGYNG